MFKKVKEGYKFANIIIRFYVQFNRTSGSLWKQVEYTYIIDSLIKKIRKFLLNKKFKATEIIIETTQGVAVFKCQGSEQLAPVMGEESARAHSMYLRQQSGPLSHSAISLLVSLPCLREKTFCLMTNSPQKQIT